MELRLSRAQKSPVGPLEEFAEGYMGWLAGWGYSQRSAEGQLGVFRHLSRWLAAERMCSDELAGDVVGRFVAERRGSYRSLRSERALVPVLEYLRSVGVVPPPAPVRPADPPAVVAERFASYLGNERGLGSATVRSYASQVRPFLVEHVAGDGQVRVSAREVSDHVARRWSGQRPRSMNVGANALRALLRWLWMERLVPEDLSSAVGAVAARADLEVPRALNGDELAGLPAGLPEAATARLRDEAVLALMTRMGLRAGEVAALRLDDVLWRVGVIVVHGKANRTAHVPLPGDVGGLIVAYLQQGRPGWSPHRLLFLRVDAPYCPLTSQAVSDIAARVLDRAQIAGPGAAHRFRHTAACQVLAAGGGLVEVGQLLRHESPGATAVYAKSDIAAMVPLVRVWPGARR
jgi:site-specific recombinase XerD